MESYCRKRKLLHTSGFNGGTSELLFKARDSLVEKISCNAGCTQYYQGPNNSRVSCLSFINVKQAMDRSCFQKVIEFLQEGFHVPYRCNKLSYSTSTGFFETLTLNSCMALLKPFVNNVYIGVSEVIYTQSLKVNNTKLSITFIVFRFVS